MKRKLCTAVLILGVCLLASGTARAARTVDIDGSFTSIVAYGNSNDGGITYSAPYSDNTLNINNGAALDVAYGALSDGDFEVANNNVNLNGGTLGGSIYGGYLGDLTSTADVTGNRVTVNSGTVLSVTGGYTDGSGAADGNTVIIKGGTINGYVYGGSNAGTGDAKGNRVTISGSPAFSGTGSIYGASSAGGDATGNTVTISGSPTFSGTEYIVGGTSSGGDNTTGNRLEIKTAGLEVDLVMNFEFIDFYLPSGIKAGDTVLAPTNATDLTDVEIGVKPGTVDAPPALKVGDEITLIDNVTGTFDDREVKVSVCTFELSVIGGKLTAKLTAITLPPPGSGGGGKKSSSGGGGCDAGFGLFGLALLAALRVARKGKK